MPSPSERYAYTAGVIVANRLRKHLKPACERIAVAGSLRRGLAWVKDLELVAVPRLSRDLFGPSHDVPNELDRAIARSLADGTLTAREPARLGARYKALRDGETGMPIDLFVVLPPATWGAILAIRTGPASYSRRLVIGLRERGLRCEEGRVLDHRERVVPTPEEADFFEAAGLAWVPANARNTARMPRGRGMS